MSIVTTLRFTIRTELNLNLTNCALQIFLHPDFNSNYTLLQNCDEEKDMVELTDMRPKPRHKPPPEQSEEAEYPYSGNTQSDDHLRQAENVGFALTSETPGSMYPRLPPTAPVTETGIQVWTEVAPIDEAHDAVCCENTPDIETPKTDQQPLQEAHPEQAEVLPGEH